MRAKPFFTIVAGVLSLITQLLSIAAQPPTPSIFPPGGIVGYEVVQLAAPGSSQLRYRLLDTADDASKPFTNVASATSIVILPQRASPRSVVLNAQAGSSTEGIMRRAVFWILPPPSHDHRANPQLLAGDSGSIFSNTRGATGERDELPERFALYAPKSVWFKWTATESAEYKFQFTPLELGGSVLSILNSAGSAILVEKKTVQEKTETLVLSATSGATYLFRAASPVRDGSGAFSLSWRKASLPVAAPVFGLRPGTYTGPVPVPIRVETPGALIRFTRDGREPVDRYTQSYDPENPPYIEEGTETIKARAFAPGFPPSPIVTATYTATNVSRSAQTRYREPEPPIFTPTNGFAFTGPSQVVSLKSPVSGAIFRYTTDGHFPTQDNPVVPPAGVVITNTTRLIVRVWEPGHPLPSLPFEATIAKAGVDSDSDGLPDSWEAIYHSNPFFPDAERECRLPLGRGLPNWKVFLHPDLFTQANMDRCTAEDGIPDWWKVMHNLNLDHPIASKKDRSGLTMLHHFEHLTEPQF